MSKSLGNYIGIDEPPNDMFGKTMSLPDSMIVTYFDYLTDVPNEDVEQMKMLHVATGLDRSAVEAIIEARLCR